MGEAAQPMLFQAMIVPHRSLSRRGLVTLVAVIAGLSAAITTAFWWFGAWPVAGFSGPEVLLALVLLRRNARGARASEMLLLDGEALRIVRTDARGRREERRLPAAWLGVVLEDVPSRVPRLLLAARGVREEVGRALGEEAKRDLARALGDALHGMRHPVFDNAQLRGEG
jgi:uncharacterized membrane protein